MSDEKILLASIPKNDTERLEISISEYKGKKYLDLRNFYTTDEGQSWLPTKKGVTIYPDNLELLKDSIEKAMEELKDAQ